jgi:hypothetical protein
MGKIANAGIIPVLAGAGVLALSLGVARPKLIEENKTLKAEGADLEAQLARVSELEMNAESYQQQSEAFDRQNAVILDRYPSRILEEDVILYARQIESTFDSRIHISKIGTNPVNLVYAAGAGLPTEDTAAADESVADGSAAEAAGTYDLGIIEEADVAVPDYQLYSMPVTWEFSSGYEDMKSMIQQILSDPDARDITAMSLNYDAGSGKIIGSMNMDFFYLEGTQKAYVDPDTGVTERGKEDIYDTMSDVGTDEQKE